ncbi:2-dehydropantoate 2-reductase [Actinoplanes octamycinicus]|uniref:2-dehydropantoate 2-reductase n=1 Tax=Actinoplanes octamycinicus TaxID=135948 RepID=A0A7W7H7U5_9ACTN|nr:ketopantoate reductase family protein [Actinoplanes octamycinicus]MBB4745633.1 2-dehydropantoate 2-reductase [Actinoplanes octamycinicus]GIE56476.1 2-dehydropantoate 2-reductase [Actinoplanes octamycinicus]
MRILVAGAGATGGYFGGRLAQAGRDVTFLVRPGRQARLAERGLRITSPTGETRLTPRTVTTVDGPYDLVLIAVKSYALDAVIAALGPAVGDRTVVIPLLNGMRHVDTLTGAFGPGHVWGGLCMIHGTLDDHGDVVQMSALHRLVFGPFGEGPDDRLDKVTAALGDAGFDSRASRHIRAEMWEKWVLLATIGGATTLQRGSIGAINAAPGGPEFNRALTAETVAVATAAGFPPRPQALTMLRDTMASTEPTTSSMYRDLIAGHPVEADAIVGDLVAEAGRHDVPVPLLSAAWTALSIYQATREAD